MADDLDRLLELLPEPVRLALAAPEARDQLLEVVLDLGRIPEARYPGRALALGSAVIERRDLGAVVEQLGPFGGDNRAGIERTLHRISAIRNRTGEIVGLTCRVGRAVYGTVAMVLDLLDTGQSLLLMGRPGVGKTTALREIARVLADDLLRRVVVIDTSNEIAGDGDIPHPAIGRARRMQVARPELQHQVMIEAVENHMPEVIVIDEIGTELEAQAARTIAERGVMLVATAHGNALGNLLKNPTLSDLVGGIESVTLGDEEARRRRSQKTVQERAAEPTFPLAVEMHSRSLWLVHLDVAATVDLLLRGQAAMPQLRQLGADGQVLVQEPAPPPRPPASRAPSFPSPFAAQGPARPRLVPLAPVPLPDPRRRPGPGGNGAVSPARTHPIEALETGVREPSPPSELDPPGPLRLYGVGVSAHLWQQAVRSRDLAVQRVESLEQAEAVLAVRQQLGLDPQVRRSAHRQGLPILVIKADTLPQIQRGLERLLTRRGGPDQPRGIQASPGSPGPLSSSPGSPSGFPSRPDDSPDDSLEALEECRLAVEQVVLAQGRPIELLPRREPIRALQAELVARYRLASAVFGRGDQQRLRVFPP
ncbi:MAG: AAA family ATPase [Synechococcales cyanobacterium SupBloom_Metag_052]|nr:AAA family ATPase [Synechococcales cyanobacterium SupBloom_Metag_052]